MKSEKNRKNKKSKKRDMVPLLTDREIRRYHKMALDEAEAILKAAEQVKKDISDGTIPDILIPDERKKELKNIRKRKKERQKGRHMER